jgi:hypothetical protein
MIGLWCRAGDALVAIAENFLPLPGRPAATGHQVEPACRRELVQPETRSFVGQECPEGEKLAGVQAELSGWFGTRRSSTGIVRCACR